MSVLLSLLLVGLTSVANAEDIRDVYARVRAFSLCSERAITLICFCFSFFIGFARNFAFRFRRLGSTYDESRQTALLRRSICRAAMQSRYVRRLQPTIALGVCARC